MPDYQKGKIYTIRCNIDQNLIYVGSTTQTISQRWTDHKKNSQNPNTRDYNMKVYQAMREKGIDNFYVELYEDYPCENRAQLGKREGELIREIGTLNKQITGRTVVEYTNELENKVHKQEYMKEYHIKNREKRAEYNKEYRMKNYDELLLRKKEYRVANVAKIKEKKSQIYTCECGCVLENWSKSQHVKSKKHIKLMASKQESQ